MKKIVSIAFLALLLAGCQTTMGGLHPTTLSKLENAGFLPVGQAYVCYEARCGVQVGIAAGRSTISLPNAVNFTAEQAIKSGNVGVNELKRGMEEQELKKQSGRLIYQNVVLDKANSRIFVSGTTQREAGLFFFSGSANIRGNEVIGFMAVSKSKSHAARYARLITLD